MVNGNYILYGDRPPSESTYIEDHVIERTDKKNKRKVNRTANDLQRTLNLAQLDNDTDSVKYEKKIKEPKLLRYIPNTEVEENYVVDKFETPAMKTVDEPPRRYAFAKKPKNPSDGSVHYAYSRSSSSCSSPNGNLPTISEQGEQYGTYKPPEHHGISPTESPVPCDSRFEKYFAKPREFSSKKYSPKGTHPDSLYRVPPPGKTGSKAAKALRMIRWPAALITVCVALGVFVYFLMPDPADTDTEALNGTYWETNIAAHSHNVPTQPSLIKKGNKNGTKTSEIDFYDATNVENANTSELPSVQKEVQQKKENAMLPIPPVFPTHVTPEVQYGNEKADVEPKRTSKLLLNNNDDEDLGDTTLKPHITQKPEKPLAIYFKDGEVLTSVENLPITESESNQDIKAKQYKNTNPNEVLENIPRDSVIPDVKFTSGHSKIFGISIEDAEKLRSTTQSSLYNTKVSPTLPVWKNIEDVTTANYPVNHGDLQPQCRSTSLPICRGVHPYDLAGPPASPGRVDLGAMMPQIEYLMTSNCSERLRHFLCAILEPECSPIPKLPCYNLCKVVSDGCEGLIPQELLPLFRCKKYSFKECAPIRAPCFTREMPCSDGTCIPRDWMCDGRNDCPGGEDELLCSMCNKNEFRCPSGGCIQSRWVCDGYKDCAEGEDESPETCRTEGRDGGRGELAPGDDAQGSAPAPAVHARDHKQYQKNKYVENESSKELLMTSDSGNGLRRNFTRRPTPARLSPYWRPGLKEPKPTDDNTLKNKDEDKPISRNVAETDTSKLKITATKKNITKESEEDLNIGDLNFFEEFEKDVGKNNAKTTDRNLKKQKDKIDTDITTDPSTKIDTGKNAFEKVINGAELLRQAQEKAAKEVTPEEETPDYDLTMSKGTGPFSSHSSPCPSSDLRCVDGRCITLAQLCDGTIDCSDHADEDNCYT